MIIIKVVTLALAALLANIYYFHAGTTTRDLFQPMQPLYVLRPKLDYLRYGMQLFLEQAEKSIKIGAVSCRIDWGNWKHKKFSIMLILCYKF